MLKYFMLSIFLFTLTWQVFGEDPVAEEEEFGVTSFNDTDGNIIPQPRYAQLSINEKTYTFMFIPVNWYTAVELCNSQNQVIATVKSAEEATKLYDALYSNGLIQGGSTFWLGATELAHYGSWFWFNSGRPVMYTNWRAGEPNNVNNREHCLELLNDGQWNDNDCDSPRQVICENRPICNRNLA